MNTYANMFRLHLEQAGKSKNTIDTYTRNTELFIDWFESTYKDDFKGKIILLDCQEYSRYLTDIKKQSINSIKTKLQTLQKFVDFLAANGYMSALKVPQKKGSSDPKVEVLTVSELRKYIREVQSEGNALNTAVVMLLLNTGIRESELCALELSDIVITERKGFIKIRKGKGDKYREIPLNKDTRYFVTEYLKTRPTNTESEKVFIGQRGALTRTAIYKIVNKLGEKHIKRNVYPHMLRHQCFTTMAKNPDIDLKTISAIAGHSSVELTAKYYINSSEEEKRNAVENLSFFND